MLSSKTIFKPRKEDKKMKTLVRIMFVLLLCLGLVATIEKTATSASPEKIELKLVVFNMAEKKVMYAIREFCDKIKDRSGGRLEIKVVGGAEVFAPPDQLAKCKAGLVDLVFCPAGYWASLAPELAYDGLPYEVSWDGLGALMDAVRPLANAVYDKHGVRLVGDFYLTIELMTKEPVRTMAILGRPIETRLDASI
jgi:TRAP-type C4-dicarboxylate transport system substrate-binding protein